jgi:hypothetical protein
MEDSIDGLPLLPDACCHVGALSDLVLAGLVALNAGTERLALHAPIARVLARRPRVVLSVAVLTMPRPIGLRLRRLRLVDRRRLRQRVVDVAERVLVVSHAEFTPFLGLACLFDKPLIQQGFTSLWLVAGSPSSRPRSLYVDRKKQLLGHSGGRN